jgi:hypothetical protein
MTPPPPRTCKLPSGAKPQWRSRPHQRLTEIRLDQFLSRLWLPVLDVASDDLTALQGAYHRAVERAIGVPFVKVKPRQARRFTEATGKLAKTDRLDAILARMGEVLEVEARRAPKRGQVRAPPAAPRP